MESDLGFIIDGRFKVSQQNSRAGNESSLVGQVLYAYPLDINLLYVLNGLSEGVILALFSCSHLQPPLPSTAVPIYALARVPLHR
jgi:hypothetical protein